MKINGYSLENLNATFVSFVDSPPSIIQHLYAHEMCIVNYGYSITPKQKILKLVFESEKDMSFFVSLILKDVFIEDDLYLYDGKLTEKNSLSYKHIGGDIYELSVTVLVIKKSPLVKMILKSEINLISVIGTFSCPCIYKITALEDSESVNIGGHVIKKLVKGKEYILDGIKKKVLCDQDNNMLNVVLKDGHFPYLEVGINAIEVSGPIEVSIEFYPIWV
ncbi:phage tail family protein [Beduini massiliensis]|uniref:hypothetical protein n=1 Tax=Beduini massiliensis TaxID=1585974 RepID=UPI00059AA6E7|nr:hypothetical protein [Beduini massiliensis]